MRKVKFVPGEYYHIFSRTIFNIPEFKENRNIKRLTQAFLAANSKESDKIFQILRNNENISIEKIIKIVKKRERALCLKADLIQNILMIINIYCIFLFIFILILWIFLLIKIGEIIN